MVWCEGKKMSIDGRQTTETEHITLWTIAEGWLQEDRLLQRCHHLRAAVTPQVPALAPSSAQVW